MVDAGLRLRQPLWTRSACQRQGRDTRFIADLRDSSWPHGLFPAGRPGIDRLRLEGSYEVISHAPLTLRQLRWAEIVRYLADEGAGAEYAVDLFEELRDAPPGPAFDSAKGAQRWARDELGVGDSTWVPGPKPDPRLYDAVVEGQIAGRDQVGGFVNSLRSALATVRLDLKVRDDEEPLASLLQFAHQTHGNRSGYLSSGVIYRQHGTGVAFTGADGREVDVDLVDGQVAWDAWRLAGFIADGERPVLLRSSEAALEAAVGEGTVELVRVGWYGLPYQCRFGRKSANIVRVMIEPPASLAGATVQRWTDLAGSHPTGRTRHQVQGKLASNYAALAIAEYPGEEGVYLFYCDETWTVMTDTFHGDSTAAEEQARWEFGAVEWHSIK